MHVVIINAGSSNGRTDASGASNPGSSPGPAARIIGSEIKRFQTFSIVLPNLIHNSKKKDLNH